MDEAKKYPLAPAHYPARRSSLGKRQEPRQTPPATIGHPKPDLPADGDATPRQTGNVSA